MVNESIPPSCSFAAMQIPDMPAPIIATFSDARGAVRLPGRYALGPKDPFLQGRIAIRAGLDDLTVLEREQIGFLGNIGSDGDLGQNDDVIPARGDAGCR